MAERGTERPEPAALGRGFFDGGDRRSHLEQLRHLSQWSRRVLLVTGPRGVGKTAMYRQLSATLEPRAKAARINGALVNADREVLNAVVQGFGLAAPADADTQLLRQVICEHAQAQERSDRFCVTLIDDAELLDSRSLEHLIALAAESPMRLVMFGEVRLVPAVDRLADAREVGWYEIRLSGFDVDDVRSYLAWRFSEQGHPDPMPFSDGQIREIARLSEGLPGRVDQMANVLLARLQHAGAGPRGRRFPALHKALLGLLVVLLGLAYLLWQPAGAPPAPQATRLESLEVPPVARRVVPLPEPAGALESPALSSEAPAAADIESSEPGPAEPEPRESEPAQAEPLEPEPAPSVPAQTPAETVPAETVPAETVPAEMVPAEPVPVAPVPATTEPPEPVPAATESPAPASSEAAPVEPAPAEDAGSALGVRDSRWIMQQPPSAYTLQLASFSTTERANAYLAAQAEPENFARFRLQRDGRILHVVIYGRFDERAAAQQASGTLPATVGSVQPWVRTFGQVQEGVRTALQP